jgi:HSP20 family protein
MELTRFDPRTGLMGGADLFRSFFDEVWPRAAMSVAGGMFEADVVELEDEIQVIAELPGVRLDDLDLTLEANVLTVTGEKQDRRGDTERQGRYHLFERRWGRFSRSFVLPREVDRDQVSASFENGVLTVRIAKAERSRPRRIEIQTSETERRLEAPTG